MKWLLIWKKKTDSVSQTIDRLRDEMDAAELEYWAADKDARLSLSRQADALEKWRLALHKYNEFLEEVK